MLTEEHRVKRLAWAIKHKDWTREDWEKVIWSDECSVERGTGQERDWVFRTPAQKWDKEMIQTYKKGKDVSVMVWASFWGSGISDLYLLERDFEAKKHGYSANSYIQVLDDNLLGIYEPGLIFMQDNASIHTAHKVRDWFKEHNIKIMEWPPYSPDLNPIEHLWIHLKRLIYQVDPDIDNVRGDDDKVRKALFKALFKAWELIDKDILYNCIDSMTTRINAVIEADGWHTRY
jgi:transposase